MTNLSNIDICKLTAIVLRAPCARTATKDLAVARLRKAADAAGIDAASIDAVLATDNLAAAVSALPQSIQDANPLAKRATATDERGATEAEPTNSPGLRRLRSSAKAEAIRTETAREAEEGTKAKPLPKPTTPKPIITSPITAAAVATRATPTRTDAGALITAVKPNPKKPGSKSFERFALYRAGETVQTFIDACVAAGFTAKEAMADIGWDRRHGFITVGTATASNRPGDMAAVYAEETGVSYSEALVACNMD